MPLINILSPHVADMIAAGEVVERPASVVKELIENAFDAGAKNVTVEIRGGGTTYIRVTDDGCGMAPEDAGVAFLRHATSKLHDERGLEAITTMGFRGEALAAIAAVSKIELTTRRRGDSQGTRLTLEAGDIQDMFPIGAPEGTSIIIRDIFYNTPARLKFLKSDRSEASACQLAALRCALGRKDVSVKFIKDGSEEFFSPGDGKGESCVYSLLGRDTASTLLSCEGENNGLKIEGFVSSPKSGKGNRSAQYFFCNGRFIKSSLLQAAVEQAYKNNLLTGKYPACVIYISISPGSVDVNVHPAKIEVKFSDDRAIFDLVYYAVLSALGKENSPAAAPAPRAEPAAPSVSPAPKNDFYKSMSAKEFQSAYASKPAPAKSAPIPPVLRSSGFGQLRLDLPVSPAPAKTEPSPPPATAVSAAVPSEPVENPVQNVERNHVPDHKIVGEALKTYIIVEVEDKLVLIDKHAAHERMIFDRLKAQPREIMAQELLVPVTIRPSGEDAELIEANAALLTRLGFEIELFGQRDYIVRAVPADMDASEVPSAIEEICEKLRRGITPDAESVRDDILHTVACKAAIKAGWDTDSAELERLVSQVLSGAVRYCPHGRPVSVTMTRYELDKQFKRIV